MFNLWVWILFFGLFWVFMLICLWDSSGDSAPLGLISFLLGMGCFMVFCVSYFNRGTFYSDLNVNYEEVNTIKSIMQLDKNSLAISTTDSNNIVQVKEYTLDLNANTDVTSSDFDVCDGDAILVDSDKKTVEKVMATGTKNTDYHCPLVKNDAVQETITYYVVYYPLDELNVNK